MKGLSIRNEGMRAPILASLLIALTLSPAADAAPARATRLIVPGERVGPVDGKTTLESLKAALGPRLVIEENLLAPDGSRVAGAVLYPRDPSRRLEVAWTDTSAGAHPSWARVRGSATAWRTPAGVRLGTSLIELEKLNGRALTVWGFGSPRSGQVRSWNEGALAAEMRRDAYVTLKLPRAATAREVASLSQGQVFPSGDPVLRRLNPRVGEILVVFPAPKPR